MSRRPLGAREWITAGLLLPCIFACGTALDADDADLAYEGGAAMGGSGGGQLEAGSDGHIPPPDGSITDDAPADVVGEMFSPSPFTASPTAFFIHAAPNLFPVRICLEAAGTMLNEYPYPDDSPLPETNFPGIAPGGAVNVDALLAFAALHDLVTLHLVKADHILVASATPGSTMDCAELVNSSALSSDHVITFDEVDLRELRTHTVRSLVLRGCLADDTLSEDTCGGDFDPTQGNLSIRTTGTSPALYAEPTTAYVVPVHLSPSLFAYQPENSLELSFGPLGSAGANVLSADVPFETATLDPSPFTPPADLPRFADTGFTLAKVDATSDRTLLLEASLAHVQRVTSPFDTPNAFFTGANGFLLVLLGDASSESAPWLVDGAWNPAYDGRGLHALALPFQFTMGDER
jgi:hypothetical protein